jgi:hypothetical protein
MAGIKYKALVEHFRADAETAGRELREQIQTRKIKPTDFNDFGALFEACFGASEYFACRRGSQMANDVFGRALTEAAGAVSTAAFQNISGQIVYSAILGGYDSEEFVMTKMIPEQETQFLEGEKIAGITDIGDETQVRLESDPYALMGVGEDWIFTPAIKDRGGIVPLTWEAVFGDRTGQLLDRCAKVGESRGIAREKQAVDCAVDENVTTHRYNWRGTVIASYGDNSGTHTWDNLAGTNALLDWTDLDAAEQVFNGLLNPYTGEPILVSAKHLTVCKELEQTARRILSATEIRVATPGFATSANPTVTQAANPYNGKYTLVTSRYLAFRMATDTSWFLSDWSKYAKYMVAEKMNVVQAPSNNHDEFHRRIVQQYRVNERGQYVVVEPRASVKSTAA